MDVATANAVDIVRNVVVASRREVVRSDCRVHIRRAWNETDDGVHNTVAVVAVHRRKGGGGCTKEGHTDSDVHTDNRTHPVASGHESCCNGEE
jgi:hypothetical protein